MAKGKKLEEKNFGDSFTDLIKSVTNNPFVVEGKSDAYSTKDWISTGNIVLDYQISAQGGIANNKITEIVGPFASAKTLLCGNIALNAIRGHTTSNRKYKVLWFEGEGATNKETLLSFGWSENDLNDIVWIPITTVEEMKKQTYKILEAKTNGIKAEKGSKTLTKIDDDIVIIIDSIGMLGSKKEVEDVLSDNDKNDMTRAKALNSFFRLICNKVTLAETPIICINHVYKTQDLFSKTVVGGGEKATLAPRYVVHFTKGQLKKGDKDIGITLFSKVLKSTTSKYNTKVEIPIKFGEDLQYFSGLDSVGLDIEETEDVAIIKDKLKKYFQLTSIADTYGE